MYKRKAVLDDISKRDNATIIEIQPKSETCKQIRVLFTCFCGVTYSKQVNDVCGKKSTGLFCHQHSLERKRRLTLQTSLDKSAISDGATYDKSDIKWGVGSCVTFRCFCGTQHTKTLCGIQKGQGMFCKTHTLEQTRNKFKQTSMKNFGTEHPQQSILIKENVKNTIKKIYGVEYLAHNPEIHSKQHKYKFKDYVMPSGKVHKVQGYEHLAIDELLKEHSEDVISTTRIGIRYDFEGKTHIYYPDIILQYPVKKIIEVKSTHTMYYRYFYDKNIAKHDACLRQGYEFEFWIYDKHKVKTIV